MLHTYYLKQHNQDRYQHCEYWTHTIYTYIYTVVQKNCADLFLSERRQMSTDFNNFSQVDGKMSEILRGVFTSHLVRSVLPHYLVKRRSPKFAVNNDYIAYVVSIMGSTETFYHTIKRSGELSR